MITVSIYDTITPLLAEMRGRTLGMAQESLQVAGSKVAEHSKKAMRNFKHHWFNAVIDGKYVEWESKTGVKELGVRISHTQAGSNSWDSLGLGMAPRSMDSLIGFYLAPHSLTVTIGGGHPTFRPRAFKDGLVSGYTGKTVKAVGSQGRAILHKMNTGEVTDEHPYYGGEHEFKPRPFLDQGFALAQTDINTALTDRFEETFKVAINRVEVTGKWRKYG